MLTTQMIIDVLNPALAPFELEVLSATWHAQVLDVRLEHLDASAPSLEEIAQASKVVSEVLDDQDFGDHPFTLEVSSPGLERPLNQLRHFRWALGRDVVFAAKDERVEGQVLAVEDGPEPSVVVRTSAGSQTFSFQEIRDAHTVFQWGAAKNSKSDGRRQVGGA